MARVHHGGSKPELVFVNVLGLSLLNVFSVLIKNVLSQILDTYATGF